MKRPKTMPAGTDMTDWVDYANSLEAEAERLQDALLTLNHRAADGRDVPADVVIGITGMALEASDGQK